MRLAAVLYFGSFFTCLSLTPIARLKITEDGLDTGMILAVKEMLHASSRGDVSLIIITEKKSTEEIETFLGSLRGAAVFQVSPNGSHLPQIVANARQVRLASWRVMVVVVSDDPAFLDTFARQAREGRLLAWASRLVVVTLPPPHHLHPLHQTLAVTNSLLLVVDSAKGVTRATAWMVLPYRDSGVAPFRVASWTVGSGLDVHKPLFRDKFSKLTGESHILVAMERNHRHSVVMQPDPTAPDGVRVQFSGFMVTVLEYLAQGINFSYTFQRPPDGSWGIKKQDGSFTGMVGQVHREEVNFGLGPFAINAARQEGVDFTWPVAFMALKVLAGRGSAEIDPWGFLLPLAPWVWVAVLLSLLLLSITTFLSVKFSGQDISKKGFAFIHILLRQSVWVNNGVWWWERVVLGVWMLMTLVLSRSYEGNLMSLLAVRHIPQPYQSLRDVLEDPAVVMVWEKQGAPIQAVVDATAGIFYEVKTSEEQGRLKLLPGYAFVTILDELIGQRKVIIDYDIGLTATKTKHFSRTGRCDLYIGQEKILADPLALIGQKDSPLVMALNARSLNPLFWGALVHVLQGVPRLFDLSPEMKD